MAIVIPRAFSSGALSIESNARYFTLGFAFDSTLVIAAVSVVFPWSMCPIVPTFMCGLDRSNFSLAMVSASPQKNHFHQPLDQLPRSIRIRVPDGTEGRSTMRRGAITQDNFGRPPSFVLCRFLMNCLTVRLFLAC